MRLWFEFRATDDRHSQDPMIAIEAGEAATVRRGSTFALRLAMLNDGEETAKVVANLVVPIETLPSLLDKREEDYVVSLPTAGDPPERWVVTRRQIWPGSVAVVDLGVALDQNPHGGELTVRAEVAEEDGSSTSASMTLRVR